MAGGWAFPNSNSNSKAHYFESDAWLSPSLCNRWGHVGQPFQGDMFSAPSPSDCVACTKKVEKIVARILAREQVEKEEEKNDV